MRTGDSPGILKGALVHHTALLLVNFAYGDVEELPLDL